MSECDFLDVANVGKIQSEGYLVVLHPDSRVCNVSSNICEASFTVCALETNPRAFIETPITRCFSKVACDNMFALPERHFSTHCWFTCDISNNTFFMTFASTWNGNLFEIFPGEGRTGVDLLAHGRLLSRLMAPHTDCESLFATACSVVTEFVEYDRCMVYQFQQDLSGKVVYERIRPAIAGTVEPYIDTYFPASDIPLPARQMFLIRPVRVIFDNLQPPVNVLGGPREGATDLSKCTLRANHPVHTSYMKNMGVRSSMSIAIVEDNELWGLMCFHAYREAVRPQGWEASFFESLSVPVSINTARIHRDVYEKRRDSLSRVIDQGFTCRGLLEFFQKYAIDLVKVTEADCVSVLLAGRVHSWGDSSLVVTEEAIKRILRNCDGQECVVVKLGEPRRGVLCITRADLPIAFVRKSAVSDKVWGGNPYHVKIMRPDGVPGPRGSFERYVQSGADSLNKWDIYDQRLATYLSSRMKLVSTTFDSFSNNLRLLVQPESAGRPGQTDYTTVAEKPAVLDTALASHFSHEMKTPIHGLSSSIALLLEDSEMTQRETRQQLMYSMECVEHISKVVDDVLTVVCGQNVRGNTARERRMGWVRLHELFKTIRGEFGDEIKLTASNNVAPKSVVVMVDRDELRDSLLEMIQNSASSAEQLHLSMSCHETHREAVMAWKDQTAGYAHRNIRNSEDAVVSSESDSWYTFSVKDYGCGVHSDMLDKMAGCGDDTRSPAALTQSHQGAGFGDYKWISGVMFRMNGSVGIASTVSEGTTRSMIIPAARAEPHDDTENSNTGAFLVVDDNTINRKLAGKMISVAFAKKLGIRPTIREFSDGRLCVLEAERMMARGEKILGILMDHHLPVMTGKEATTRIRGIEPRDGSPKIPIFGFTADSTQEMRKDLLDSGMNGVLPKPLPMSLLEETCVLIGRLRGNGIK